MPDGSGQSDLKLPGFGKLPRELQDEILHHPDVLKPLVTEDPRQTALTINNHFAAFGRPAPGTLLANFQSRLRELGEMARSAFRSAMAAPVSPSLPVDDPESFSARIERVAPILRFQPDSDKDKLVQEIVGQELPNSRMDAIAALAYREAERDRSAFDDLRAHHREPLIDQVIDVCEQYAGRALRRDEIGEVGAPRLLVDLERYATPGQAQRVDRLIADNPHLAAEVDQERQFSQASAARRARAPLVTDSGPLDQRIAESKVSVSQLREVNRNEVPHLMDGEEISLNISKHYDAARRELMQNVRSREGRSR